MQNKVNHPILFQGRLNQGNYFEGWYFKQVTADQKISLSFIPGISLNEGDRHSFIQYILVEADADGQQVTHTGYVRYGMTDFQTFSDPFQVRISDSYFSETQIAIQLRDRRFSFQGTLKLGMLHPIETNLVQPNIMGIFGYLPKMECYHGVISMKHDLSGRLTINDGVYDFTGGWGYIEKDWGTSFPEQYIWLHSNHFENPSASLFFSVAHIPFHFTEFEGFICNFVVDGKEHRFATYNGSRCTIEEITPKHVTIRLENQRTVFVIKARVFGQGELIAPVEGTMMKTIKEGIGGILEIRLEDKKTGRIYEDMGENAGVEIVDYV